MTFYMKLAFTSGLALRIKVAAYFTKSKLSETDNKILEVLEANSALLILEQFGSYRSF
jgi:hypothetical protein